MFDLSTPQSSVSLTFDSAEALNLALEANGMPPMQVPGSAVVDGRRIETQKWYWAKPVMYRLCISSARYTEAVYLSKEQAEKLAALVPTPTIGMDAMCASDVVASLIAEAPLDKATRAPIYTELYCWVVDDHQAAGDILVTHVSGDFTARLRRIAAVDVSVDDRIYIRIEHEVKYPYAGVDFVEVMSERQLAHKPQRAPYEFCEAALVATPKLALIG